MKSRNRNTPQVDHALARAANFEISIADLARRSERRAWVVAWSAVVMSLILAGGYFYMLPLKQKVPYLVMACVHRYRHRRAPARGFQQSFVTTSEAVNRSTGAFRLARESYDIALMNLRDWTGVHHVFPAGCGGLYGTAFQNQSRQPLPDARGNSRPSASRSSASC